jgi:SAM-dependent methyltransferase
MNQKFTEEQIRELENQLSCPNGEMGIELGKNMNQSNFGMTLNTIEFLDLENENSILELGHGNCGHLDKLLSMAEEIKYFGLEISEAMLNEAKKYNSDKQAEFKLYGGEIIPYSNKSFDKILSVNTVYFWENPERLIDEIERTLKPSGICVLTYANKNFMKNLPFVGQKFKLFDQNEIKKLTEKSNLTIIESKELTEHVKSKTGEQVERYYTMTKLKRL